jgi:hypothetical protein
MVESGPTDKSRKYLCIRTMDAVRFGDWLKYGGHATCMKGNESRSCTGSPGAKSNPVARVNWAFHEPLRVKSMSAPPSFVEKIVVGASGGGGTIVWAEMPETPDKKMRMSETETVLRVIPRALFTEMVVHVNDFQGRKLKKWHISAQRCVYGSIDDPIPP